MHTLPGIRFRGRPRRASIVGTGLDVWEIIDLLRSYGGDVDEVRSHHPLVTDRHVRLARAYAERFPEEIEHMLAVNGRPLEELRALYPFLQVAE